MLALFYGFMMLLSAVMTAFEEKPVQPEIRSPNGQIVFRLEEQPDGKWCYDLYYGDIPVLTNSPLGLVTDKVDFSSGAKLAEESRRRVQETYRIGGAQTEPHSVRANEWTVDFVKNNEVMQLQIRAYDDGIAFRYVLPGTGRQVVLGEESGFRLPSDAIGWLADYAPHYEATYEPLAIREINEDSYLMPALFSTEDHRFWALITEASVFNSGGGYPASQLVGSQRRDGLLKLAFPEEQKGRADASGPLRTPWRAVIVGDGPGTIVESNLVYSLNPPLAPKADISWIRPGRAVWSYWSEDVDEKLEDQMRYVDFASRMGWEYVTVDSKWEQWEIQSLIPYAAGKNVGVIIWVHSRDLDTQDKLDRLLPEWKSWGVAGLKVDFFENDNTETMRSYERIARKAFEQGLILDFHGSTKPAGENRTWPNILALEAVRGAEWQIEGKPQVATHEATVPFTRGVVGPMDYTPVTLSQAEGMTTFANQLALSVLFESHLQHFADNVNVYAHWIGRHFLKAVPAVWDELRFVEGYPGEYVTLARRSGETWFVGSVSTDAREADIPLSFLGPGRYTATIFQDGNEAWKIDVSSRTVTREDTLRIPLGENGGLAIHLSQTPLQLEGEEGDTYEAEGATAIKLGQTTETVCTGCSGYRKVEAAAGGGVRFSRISAPAQGMHRVVLHYVSDEPGRLGMRVNQGPVQIVELPPSGIGLDKPGVRELFVELSQNANSIEFTALDNEAPAIDRIQVSPSRTGVEKRTALETRRAFDRMRFDRDGTYAVTVYYKNPGLTAGAVRASWDDGSAFDVLLPATGPLEPVGKSVFTAELTAGLHRLELIGGANFPASIERIVWAPVSAKYEMKGTDSSAGEASLEASVPSTAAGVRLLRLVYRSAVDAEAALSVNGSLSEPLRLSATQGEAAEAIRSVELAEGTNRLRLSAGAGTELLRMELVQ
ncbi:glycoside hydrolase family 97 catalytic domain-containing protein [Cohnella cellulosilytica]|uniref:Glycoside hydrolase family 97 catalytic domain-containing protein n=1 Tax=Cohnella cellulosilytica TaxID=986710 RepID=A0ABW2FP15_9BACL